MGTLKLEPWKKYEVSQQFFQVTPAKLGFEQAPTIAEINTLLARRTGRRLSGILAPEIDARCLATETGEEWLLFNGRPDKNGSQKVLLVHRDCPGHATVTALEYDPLKVIWLHKPIVFCSQVRRI